MKIDLNADLGEGFGRWKLGDDSAMLDIVSSANIACGFHAGDPDIMRATVELACKKGVAVGAHPGYRDLTGFGRRALPGTSLREIENLVAYQVGAFAAVCSLAGHECRYVKTHGALGNACADNDDMAMAVAAGIAAVNPAFVFLVMPGTATARAAAAAELKPAYEIYADRTYADNFNLTPRSEPGAVIHDAELACRRVMRMLEEGAVIAESGNRLEVPIDSICVHGDNPSAVEMANGLRRSLERNGWSVAPFTG